MYNQDRIETPREALLNLIHDALLSIVEQLKKQNTELKRIGDCVNNLSAED